MNKKIMFVMIAMVAVLANSMFIFATGNIEKNESAKYVNSEFDIDSEFLKNQYEASEDYAKVIEYVEGGASVSRQSTDYYGGAYINEQGKLVMLLVEDLENVKDDIKEISPDIIFEEVKYSYNKLNTVISEIGLEVNSALSTRAIGNIFSDVKGMVLLDSQNKIEVYIEDINDEKIKQFMEEFNYSDMFVFKESEGGEEQAGSTAPGEYISSSSGSGLTAGFRARRTLSNGVVETGFLTCAHGNTYGDSIKDSDGNVLGTVTYRAYGGSADISFVKLNNGSSVSNTLAGTSYYKVNTTASNPISGKIVYLFGATSGKTWGEIESTNVSFTYNNQYFSNMIGASYHVFTSYSNVKNTFNLTRY